MKRRKEAQKHDSAIEFHTIARWRAELDDPVCEPGTCDHDRCRKRRPFAWRKIEREG